MYVRRGWPIDSGLERLAIVFRTPGTDPIVKVPIETRFTSMMKKLLLIVAIATAAIYFSTPLRSTLEPIAVAAGIAQADAGQGATSGEPLHSELRKELRRHVAERQAADDAQRQEQEAAPAPKAEVVMYATAWCPYCKKARDFLRKEGIEYKEYDIEKSQEGRRQHQALGGGGVPVIVVNGTVVRGYNPQGILAALKR